MKKENVRAIALDILEQVEKNQAYSNLLLNHRIETSELNRKDVGLLTEIVYGTIQHRNTLDFYLAPFIKGNKKIAPWVITLLRLSLYQMVYLDRIPARAVIYEAVEIAKTRGHKGIQGFVNGVLRNIDRTGVPSLKEVKNEVKRISLETSHPEWLIERLIKQYGAEEAIRICKANLIPPKVTARVNLARITVLEVIARLANEGVTAKQSELIPCAIVIESGHLPRTDVFKEGLVTIQDESSMLVAYALDLKPDQKVLDSCAAPGGKTTHIAEKLNNTGTVLALDLHEHKVKLIKKSAKRLQLTNVTAKVSDARDARQLFKDETFDRILVDAPCSGLGVIRRKPDMKWTKTQRDIDQLSSVQLSILRAVAPLVKTNGKLVYSTCTIDQEENRQVVEQFLNEHPSFTLDETMKTRMPKEVAMHMKESGQFQLLPHYFLTDGFFIACFVKKQ